MNHPYIDAKLAKIVGPRPSDDHVWCDECVRWEVGYGNPRPKVNVVSKLLHSLARWLLSLARALSYRADLIQAKHLVERGEGVSTGRSTP